MDPVDSNASNGFISVAFPLNLVDQAREVMLGANRELFLEESADTSETPAQFSRLSSQISARLDDFSTLLSSTEFFNESFSDQMSEQGDITDPDAENFNFSETLESDSLFEASTNESVSGTIDLDAQEQSVRTVINEYNELIEWLDSSQSYIGPSLKEDLFKDIDSEVLEEKISGTSANQENTDAAYVDGTAPQSRKTDGFSPQVSDTSNVTAESVLSQIGLTLNSDGTLDVEEDFNQQLKTNFSRAYDILSGEEGFFTKISASLDALKNIDSRFNVNTHDNNNTQGYTCDPEAQVRNVYRENVASLFNTFA